MTIERYGDYLSDWVEIEGISQKLLDFANAENWTELQQLAEYRNSCLKKFFTKDIPSEYAQNIAEGIDKIKGLDKRLTTLAQESRDHIRQELLAMSKIKSVQQAYNDNK